jgi:hypothetical protein
LKQDPAEEHEVGTQQPAKLAEMKALYQKTYGSIPKVEPYGGNTLKSGRVARGPMGPK